MLIRSSCLLNIFQFWKKCKIRIKSVGGPEVVHLRGDVYKNRELTQSRFTVFHFFPTFRVEGGIYSKECRIKKASWRVAFNYLFLNYF